MSISALNVTLPVDGQQHWGTTMNALLLEMQSKINEIVTFCNNAEAGNVVTPAAIVAYIKNEVGTEQNPTAIEKIIMGLGDTVVYQALKVLPQA